MKPGATALVAHPGAAHFIYELVVALAGLRHPVRFETGFYHDSQGGLARLVGRLPERWRSRIGRELMRRNFAGLDPAWVRPHAGLELAYVAAARGLKRWPAIPDRIMHWRNAEFDSRVAAGIRRAPPDLVIGHDTSCRRTLEAARGAGSLAVMNQMIGHLAVGDAILGEEAVRQPDWADSLHAGAPAWLIEQCRAEALTADRILVPSDYVADSLRQIGVPAERIALLPFGVRVDRFRPAERPRDDGKLRLLYVGQISQRKGLSYLLEAVRRLARPDIELILVGGLIGAGAGLRRYEGCYRHVPNLPHAEIPALFRDADLFVYPSLHEGSALAIFEAMASGLPVITTPNAGSMVRHGQDGLILPIRDPDAIARAITDLADDPARRSAMAVSARARALEFTWDHYRARLGDLIAGW